MTQYIGQITVILESDTPSRASETLCDLAKQLDDTSPEVIFADHNGAVEDYEKIERECAAPPEGNGHPILPYAENEAHSLESLKDSPEANAEADHVWKAVEAAQAAIAPATAAGPPLVSGEPDLHALLIKRREIAHLWGIEDVQHLRPGLTDDQAWDVLQHVDRHINSDYGITWLTLEHAIERLFGPASEANATEEA